MRRQLMAILCLVLLSSFVAVDVDAAKIKHLKTLYVDSAGEGLKQPSGVACDQKTVVVSDTGNRRIVFYSWSTQVLVAQSTLPLKGIVPGNIQVNSRGDLYLFDEKTRSIIKIGPNGAIIGKLEPTGIPSPEKVVPRSFRFDQQDNIYLLDIFSGRVLKLDVSGKYLAMITLPEDYGFFSDLEIGPKGTIYLLDSVAGVIFSAGPDDDSFTAVSQGLKEYINFPVSMAIDSQGIFYLSDKYGSGLALVGRDGGFLGHRFNMGWEDGQLNYPGQICIDSQDLLYVADKNNNRIQIFQIMNE